MNQALKSSRKEKCPAVFTHYTIRRLALDAVKQLKKNEPCIYLRAYYNWTSNLVRYMETKTAPCVYKLYLFL